MEDRPAQGWGLCGGTAQGSARDSVTGCRVGDLGKRPFLSTSMNRTAGLL